MDASGCLAVGALQVALDQQVPAAMAQLLLDYERRSMEAEDKKALVHLQDTAKYALTALYAGIPDVAVTLLETGGVQADYARRHYSAGAATELHTADPDGTAAAGTTAEEDVNMEDEDAATE